MNKDKKGTEEYSNIEERTKEIYIEQHKNYIKDKRIFERFYSVAVDPSTYLLKKDSFKNINVLDVGCGNTGYFQKAMYDLGVKHITCIDIGEDWIPELDKVLKSLKIPETFYTLSPGLTTNIRFPDNSFDFVASNGVLMHLDGKSEAELALKELARVTKPGGYLYAYIGVSKPAIMDKYLLPAFREAYKEELEFKSYIDEASPEKLKKDILRYINLIGEKDSTVDINNLKEILELITLDTCTFLQNALQVPVEQSNDLSLEWATVNLEKNGIGNIQRIPEIYWERHDIRKFLAPFHYDREGILGKLFYGDGHIKIIGRKQ